METSSVETGSVATEPRSRLGQRLARALAGALAALACGSPPNVREVDNSINIHIYPGGESAEPPAAIDPEDPRVAVNEAQLAALLGRPLRFEVDRALAARFGAGLHDAYVAALESATAALTECQRTAPAAFAYGAERLEAVRLTYTAVRARERPRVPLLEPTLTLPVPPNFPTLLDGGSLCAAFEGGREATSGAGKPERRDAPADPRLAALAECERAANQALAAASAEARRALGDTLVSCAVELREAARSRESEPELGAAFDRVRPVWMDWVNRHLSELDEGSQFTVARDLFRSGMPELDALREGFDAPRFALPIIDVWVQRAPPEASPDEFGTALERCAVSAVPSRPHGILERQGPCRGYGYSDLATTAKGRQRLLQRLQRWNSDLLTQTAVLHTLDNEGAPTTLALLETLAADRRVAHAGLLAVARHHQFASRQRDPRASIDPAPIVAAAPAWWRKHPEQRAAYLYVLTQIASKNEGAVPWASLGRFLGGRIDAATLRAYLAFHPENIWYVSQLRGAFEPGFARAPVLREGLEAFLEAFQAGKAGGLFRPSELPERLVAAVCEGGSRRDVEQLRTATRELSEIYDRARGATLYLRDIARTPAERLCPSQARGEPAEPVLFGD